MKNVLLKWVRLSSFVYFLISFTMNMIFWIAEKEPTIIKFNHNLIILLFSFLILGIISIFTYNPKPKQPKFIILCLYKTSVSYTLITFYLRIHALIDNSKPEYINNSKMLLLVLIVSLVIAISLLKIKINKYWLKSIYYFIIIGISYILIFIVQAKYQGISAIIAISIYLALFLIIDSLLYILFVKNKNTKKNKEKTYNKMF